MPTENARDKGKRMLTEGRLNVLQVKPTRIVAECRGDSGEIYRLGWAREHKGWFCPCPAKGVCSHLRALQLVTVKPSPPLMPPRA